jgi:hypothetical protein
MWCWAACAEMVLSYKGVEIPQEAIVGRAKGYVANGTGSPLDMFRAVNGLFTTAAGTKVIVSGQFVLGAPAETVVYTSLKNDCPMILTYQSGPQMGHAIVLIGIDCTVNPDCERNPMLRPVVIQRLHIIDPFDFTPQPVLDRNRQPMFQMTPWGPMPVTNGMGRDSSLRTKIYDVSDNTFSAAAHPLPGMITGCMLVASTNEH